MKKLQASDENERKESSMKKRESIESDFVKKKRTWVKAFSFQVTEDDLDDTLPKNLNRISNATVDENGFLSPFQKTGFD